MAWLVGLARAEQILATELAYVEALFFEIATIKKLCCFLPTTGLVSGFNVGLAAQGIDVGLLKWIGPFAPRTNKHRVAMNKQIR